MKTHTAVQTDYFDERSVYAATATGIYPDSYVQAWASLSVWIERHKLANRIDEFIGCCSHEITRSSKQEIHYSACVDISGNIPDEYVESPVKKLDIPDGRFAYCEVDGGHDRVVAAFDQLARNWTAVNQEEVDGERALLEKYAVRPLHQSRSDEITVACLPIKSKLVQDVAEGVGFWGSLFS